MIPNSYTTMTPLLPRPPHARDQKVAQDCQLHSTLTEPKASSFSNRFASRSSTDISSSSSTRSSSGALIRMLPAGLTPLDRPTLCGVKASMLDAAYDVGGVETGSDDDVETECADPCRALVFPRDVKMSPE